MAYNNYGSYGYGGSEQAADTAGAYNPRYHFQAAQSAGFHMGSEDAQPRTLYVGNLDPSVTEEFVATLFGQIGVVTKTKVIFDGQNDPYAFVEFSEHSMAAQALNTMNRRCLLEKEMKVNWATEPGSLAPKVDTSKHFHVFVGDLSPEIDNKTLRDAFVSFGDISDAKVIRDQMTLKSKGYGFVSYPKREEAERAIEQMNGQWLGRRTIRTNWATRKPGDAGPGGPGGSSGGGGGGHNRIADLSFDDIMNMTSADNTSVYIGNIPSNISDNDIRTSFCSFGQIEEVRVFRAQGYAFCRYNKKESAAQAIMQMNGQELMGQQMRCSWGKSEYQKTQGQQQNTSYNYGAGAYGYGSQASQQQGAGYGQTAQGAQAGGNNQNSQQQYWQYFQQYYNNPQAYQQYQQQWQQGQQGQAGGQGGHGGQGGYGGGAAHH